MKITRDGDNVTTRFTTIGEALRYAEGPCKLPDSKRSSIQGSEEFTKTLNLDEAIHLAKRGWQGGTKEIQEYRMQIVDKLIGSLPMPEMAYSNRGHNFNMTRVLAGNPKAFIHYQYSDDIGEGLDSNPRIMRFVINITASGSIKHETLLRRGAAAIVLIDTLERYDIRCRVDLVAACSTKLTGGNALEYYIPLKNEGDPLSIDKMAFFLCHPSSLRRLIFAIMEHEPDDIRTRFGIGQDKGAYGIPTIAAQQGDIYVDQITSPLDWSEELTTMWLTKQLEAQGIKLSKKVAGGNINV